MKAHALIAVSQSILLSTQRMALSYIAKAVTKKKCIKRLNALSPFLGRGLGEVKYVKIAIWYGITRSK